MDFEPIVGVSAVGLIVAVIEVLKYMGMKTKLAPVVSVLLGILLSVGYHYSAGEIWYEAVITGLAVGLVPIGVYSGVKNTVEFIRS